MTGGIGLLDRVVLIYNPLNRRVPLTLAQQLQEELATRHAGHARELARAIAATGRQLIVAVSGDGVYNEIVNGVLEVPGSAALVAVAAGGNANDHRRSTRRMSLVDAVVAAHRQGLIRHLDLLQVTVSGRGWTRYAHSYVGFGLTPLMAVGLRRDRKGTLAELVSVLRTFADLTPVRIDREGRPALYDSLIFANVSRMAKYGRVASSGRPDDGLFEVVARRHGGRWRIVAMALRAVTVGLGVQARVDRVALITVDAGPMQVDGELVDLPGGAHIVIECRPGALVTVG